MFARLGAEQPFETHHELGRVTCCARRYPMIAVDITK
jgi:hypothetical protein